MKETNEWPAAAYAWSLAGGIPAATTTATQEKKKAKGSGSGSGSGNGSGGGRGSAASSASLSASARDSKGAAPKSKAAKGSKTGKATKPKAKGKPRAAKVAKPKATKAGTAKKKKQSVAAAASAAASAAADAKKGARGKKAPAGSAPRGPFPFALSSAASPSSLASSGSASAPAGIGGPVADAWRETVTHWVPVDVGRFLVNCGPGNETWFELGMFAKRNNITGPMLLAHANTPERLATLFEGYLPPVGREMSFTIMQDLRQQTPYGAQPQPGVASGHITLAANPLPAAGRGRSNAAVVRELRAALKVSQASLAALQAEHAALRASATSSTKSKGLSKSVHLNGFGAGGGSGLLGGAGMGRPGGSGGRSRASSLDMDLTSGHHAHDLLHSSDAFDDDSIMADGIYTPSEDFNISGEFNSVDNLFALISSKADVADSGPPSPTHRLGGGRSGQQPQHLPHQSHRRQSSSPIPRHSLDIDAQLEQDMDQVLRSATADRNDSASSKRGPAAMNVKQGGTGPMLLPHPAQQPRLIDDLAPGPRTPSLLQQQQLHQQQQQQLHQQKLQQQQQKLHLQQQEKLLQQKLQQQEQAQKLLEQQKLEQQQQQQQLQALLQHKLQETAQAQPRRCLLYEAAQDNDEDALRRLLARKANVNEPNEAESGATALSIAAELNHVESLELLLLAKAHVDAATTDSGETPLFIAACENSADCVRLLLAAKASVNQPTSDDGTTPVCVAAKNDNVASLEMLIAAKADVNQPTEDDGATPVYMASQSNHARSLRLLFKAKAAVNSCLKKNNGGWSPLFVAAGAGHTAVVRALLRHADIRPSVIQRSLAPRTCWNQTIPAGLTPLDVARRLKRTDCVRALANTTASVSAAAAALRAVHSQQIFQNASNGRMSTPSSALTKPGKASGAEIGASRKRPRVQNST